MAVHKHLTAPILAVIGSHSAKRLHFRADYHLHRLDCTVLTRESEALRMQLMTMVLTLH